MKRLAVASGAAGRVDRALLWSVMSHAGQLDKQGCPYIYHVLHVALGGDTEDEVIVGLLHDVVEDTISACAWESAFGDIEDEFGPDVADAVRALSHPKDEPYARYILRVGDVTLARRVKMRDIRHNMDRLDQLGPEDRVRLGVRYRAAWETLMTLELNFITTPKD